jgi:hypothetical protein
MDRVNEARQALVNEMVKWHWDGWFNFPEADETINNLSRFVIDAMQQEHGEAWLGKINLYNDGDRARPIWKWEDETVYNFGASFVMPRDDQVLRDLILARDAAEYTTAVDDMERLDVIMDRIVEVGGITLVWT